MTKNGKAVPRNNITEGGGDIGAEQNPLEQKGASNQFYCEQAGGTFNQGDGTCTPGIGNTNQTVPLERQPTEIVYPDSRYPTQTPFPTDVPLGEQFSITKELGVPKQIIYPLMCMTGIGVMFGVLYLSIGLKGRSGFLNR
jgi:hypothetical protein